MPRRSPRQLLPKQYIRFGIVGGIGFLVDAGVLRLLLALGSGYYDGRFVSFLAAATTTWILNRSFTFRRDAADESVGRRHPAGEWLTYLALMVVGGVINYAAYAVAIESWDLARRHPELGVALGSIAGMMINYWSAKTMVFARKSGR